MLRINLLPPYINERGQKRTFVVGWVIGIVLVIVAFVVIFQNLRTTLNTKKDELANASKLLDDKKNLDGQVATEKQKRAAIEAKQVFVASAKKFNDGWPEVYELMRDVTTDGILLHSMSLDVAARKTVNLTGFAKDEATIVRWWMELRNRTELFDQVSFSLPTKGFEPDKGQTGGGGMGAPMGMGGMPGSPGMPGGMGSPMPGIAGMSGMAGMGPPGGKGGFGGGGGGGNSTAVGPTEVEGRQGINFAAAAVLKTAMASGTPPPVWPAGGGAAAAGPGNIGMPNSAGMGMGGPGRAN